MAPWEIMFCTLLLFSVAASLPLNSNASNVSSTWNQLSHSHSDIVKDDEKGETLKEQTKSIKSTPSTTPRSANPTGTSIPIDEHREETNTTVRDEYCMEDVTFHVTHRIHTFVDGKPVVKNQTVIRRTRKCCDGYEMMNGKCRLNLCAGITCEEPNTKCVTVRRCGQFLPVFITGDGIISTTCTQPQVTQQHLNQCPAAEKGCKPSSCSNKGTTTMVCFDHKCDCTPEHDWVKLSGSRGVC